MAVGQNQWYHFGVGAPAILVYFTWDWDVHWGYRILTRGHICDLRRCLISSNKPQGDEQCVLEGFCVCSLFEARAKGVGASKQLEMR